MDSSNSPTQKKGLGVLAWLGIGCGSILVLVIIGFVAVTFIFGGKVKQFAEDMQKNPTRTTANTMVSVSVGQLEMVAEDDVNKRYTVKDKKTGKLTTIYWNEAKKAPEIVEGDFSAIPAAGATLPAPEAKEPGAPSGGAPVPAK